MTDEDWRVLSDFYEPIRVREPLDSQAPTGEALSDDPPLGEGPPSAGSLERTDDVGPLQAAGVFVSGTYTCLSLIAAIVGSITFVLWLIQQVIAMVNGPPPTRGF